MKINVLELFAGSRSIGKAAEKLGMNVFSSDINNFKNIDYVENILNFDIKKIPFKPTIVWASPPCTYFSVASIGHHWHENNTPKTKEAVLGVQIVQKTIDIINEINPKFWFIENPRGKLKNLPVLSQYEYTTIWYCKYNDKRAKPTNIWSNNIWNPLFNPNGWKPRNECFNGNVKCHHEAAPRGSRTGTQGLSDNYERSKIPNELCVEILKSCLNVK